jgi:exopolysaccharide biosynthesis protein
LGAGAGPSRPGHVPSIRVSSFVRDNGLLAGINTVPFDPSSSREGEERRVAGIAVAGGRIIAPPVPRYDALVFYRDGGAAIVNQGELGEGGLESPPREILHAVGGFHRILSGGELTERARQRAAGPRYARSAAGLSGNAGNGGVLYLIVINGGFPGSRGATEAETALILKRLGAGDALNLDGGGSSALALRSPRGGIRILNTPSHGGFPGRERAVALCLGIGTAPVTGGE